MTCKLSDLLGPWWPAEASLDPAIHSLSADSREAGPGALFFAIKGLHTDSHDLISGLLDQHIAAVVIEHAIDPTVQAKAAGLGIPVVMVPHARSVLSHAAAAWFGFPARKLQIVGVTGTDGKSSTVFFIWQLLQKSGLKAGFFSTVSISYGDEAQPNQLRQSTPEPLELHSILARMVANGVTHVVMESTSHGLSPLTARLADIDFVGGAFTNLSHEHLEFHGTYEQYRHDKANLFRKARQFCVLNRGDKEAGYMAAQSKAPVLFYQLVNNAGPAPNPDHLPRPALWADGTVDGPDYLEFRLHDAAGTTWPVHLPFPGIFNAENLMAALLVAMQLTGRKISHFLPFMPGLKGVKGRMIPVREGQDYAVLVDYAHTPGSFERLFPLFRASCPGKLIAVFGSAGERDTTKRPMQGRIAASHADILVLCNEDPRLEDELAIIDQIAAGALAVNPALPIYRIPDRYQAMRQAFSLAKPGDLVLLLGKGHEQSIVLKTGKIPWDDEEMARKAIRESRG